MPAKKRTIAKHGQKIQSPIGNSRKQVMLAAVKSLLNMAAVSATSGLVLLGLFAAKRFV